MPPQEGSNKQWLRKRRAAVESIVAKSTLPATRIDVEARAAAGANWTDGATAELAKLKIKHDDCKAVAFEDGHLLAKEVTDDVRARLEDIQATRYYRDRDHATAERRQSNFKRKRDSDNSIDIAGKTVFIDPGLPTPASNCVARAVRQWSLKRVGKDERHLVDLYMVSDLSKPGQRTSWAVSLTGGRVAVEQFLVSGGTAGASVVYKPTLATKMCLWMARNFIKHHAALASIVRKSMSGYKGNRWTLILKQQDFTDRYAAAVKAKRNREVIALVTKSQKNKDRDPPLSSTLPSERSIKFRLLFPHLTQDRQQQLVV